MQKLVYRNANGEELDLTDGVKFGVTTWEGFSNCGLTVQTQTVPFADGSVYLDGLLGERELAVTVAVNDKGDLGLRYQLKRELISMLNPKLGEGYLIYTNDYLSRRIKVVPYLPTFGNKNIDTAGTLKASCSFKACDPYWEDIEETEVMISGFANVENSGDVEVNPAIEIITDNANNVVITNITKGSKVKITGELTQDLSINTAVGKKSVSLKELIYNNLDIGFDLKDCLGVNDCYMAVGNKSIIVIKNGKTQLKSVDYYVNSIAYSDEYNNYCVVGNSGAVYISNDEGETWELVTSGVSTSLNCVRFIHGKYYAVGATHTIIRSSDGGETWEDISPSTDYGSYRYIYYSELIDYFVLCSSTGLYRTNDFSTYTTLYSSSAIYSIAESDSIAVLCSGSSLYYSTNYNTWTMANFSFSGGVVGQFRSIIFNRIKNFFCAVGLGGNIFISYDGINFTRNTDFAHYNELTKVYYTNSIGGMLVCGKYGLFFYTTEFVDFDYLFLELYAFIQYTINSATKYNDKYLLAKSNRLYLTDLESENYELFYTSTSSNSITFITFIEETKTLIGVTKSPDSNTVLLIKTETDTEIRTYDTGFTNDINDIKYARGIYIAVGDSGKVLTSPDCETWSSFHSISQAGNFSSIDYCDVKDEFEACTEDGKVYTFYQLDNPVWTYVSTDVNLNATFNAIKFIKNLNLWLLVGGNGNIYKKYISSAWSKMTVGTTDPLKAIDYNAYMNRVVIVGDNGVIITSSDGINFKLYINVPITGYHSIIINESDMVLIGATSIVKSVYEVGENYINNVSSDSDMNLNLLLGSNRIVISSDSGNVMGKLTYRNRYVGV